MQDSSQTYYNGCASESSLTVDEVKKPHRKRIRLVSRDQLDDCNESTGSISYEAVKLKLSSKFQQFATIDKVIVYMSYNFSENIGQENDGDFINGTKLQRIGNGR